MNSTERFLVGMQRLRDETFVRQAAAAMVGLLTAIDERWPSDGLCRHCFRHGQQVGDYFRQHEGFMAVIRRVFEQYGSSLAEGDVLADPTTLLDLSSFVAHLADEYPRALPSPASKEAERTIAELQPRMAVDFIHTVMPQVLQLAEVVWKVEAFARRTLPQGARIVIVEFPVGNSIPSKLLDRLLRNQGQTSVVVRVALSRNDSATVGITRAQLIEARLSGLALKKGDLIVLVDEWLSGSNFRNLTKLLGRIAAASDATFLPVATLTDRSASEQRYESHVREHERLLQKIGEAGRAWRFTFPRLNTRFDREGYFFWSEFDRLAGYRKFKIVGSYVSSIEAVLKTLREDQESMRRAKAHFLAMIAEMRAQGVEGPAVTPEVLADRGTLDRLFEESYEDYLQCRDQLAAIDHPTTRGEEGNIEEDIRQVVERIHQVIDGRPAKACVLLALSFIETERIVDPEDQYHLDAHAPVVVELDGGYRRMSECVMAELEALTLARRPARS
jgi:hypothetical protein